MNHQIIAVVVFAAAACATVISALQQAPKFRHLFRVPEGQAGLLYRHGLYVRRNNAGRHLVWGCGWTINLVDLRKGWRPVECREVLTSDRVAVTANLLVTYQVTEPVKAVHETQCWLTDLGHRAQLALRAVAAEIPLDALLEQRLELGAKLLERVQPEAAKFGVSVFAVEIKDIILPAELRQVFAEAAKARLPAATVGETT